MRSQVRSHGRPAVKHVLFATVLALLVPIMAQATSISTPTLACTPGTICIANQNGSATGSAAGGLSLSGADVTQIGQFTYGIGVSTLSFTTGAFITGSGSLANGGQFGAGGSFTISTSGNWNGFSGVIFQGTFSGPVSWTLVSCTGSVCIYDLTGAISGTWADGETVNGATTQLFFKTTKGKYNGGPITAESGSTFIVTPEPGTLGLMGTGLVGMGLMVRKKLKQQVG